MEQTEIPMAQDIGVGMRGPADAIDLTVLLFLTRVSIKLDLTQL